MRPQFYIDSFKDKEGKEHPFVICAVVKEVHVDDCVFYTLNLGYSICNPHDTFNENLGKTIALGRANKKEDYDLLTFNKGTLNIKVICAVLNSEADYLKRNPGYKVAGYK